MIYKINHGIIQEKIGQIRNTKPRSSGCSENSQEYIRADAEFCYSDSGSQTPNFRFCQIHQEYFRPTPKFSCSDSESKHLHRQHPLCRPLTRLGILILNTRGIPP